MPDPKTAPEVVRTAPTAPTGPVYANIWAAPIAVTTTRIVDGRPVQVVVPSGQDLPADADPGTVGVLTTVGYVAVK